jgi:hypothetical protein
MNGLGGLNTSENGVVIGLVQLQLPVVKTPADPTRQTAWIRGFTAVRRGALDCPYTYMQDIVAGRYRLPLEDSVRVTGGTSCGFPAPTRAFGQKEAAE